MEETATSSGIGRKTLLHTLYIDPVSTWRVAVMFPSGDVPSVAAAAKVLSLLMGMGGSGMGSSLEDVPLCRCWCDPRRPRTNGIDGDRFVQHRLLVSTIVPGLVVALARQGGHQMQTVNLVRAVFSVAFCVVLCSSEQIITYFTYY